MRIAKLERKGDFSGSRFSIWKYFTETIFARLHFSLKILFLKKLAKALLLEKSHSQNFRFSTSHEPSPFTLVKEVLKENNNYSSAIFLF